MSGLGDAAQLLAPAGNPEAARRLLREFARERDALAARFGLGLPDAALYFDEIGGLPPMEPERALGPANLSTCNHCLVHNYLSNRIILLFILRSQQHHHHIIKCSFPSSNVSLFSFQPIVALNAFHPHFAINHYIFKPPP